MIWPQWIQNSKYWNILCFGAKYISTSSGYTVKWLGSHGVKGRKNPEELFNLFWCEPTICNLSQLWSVSFECKAPRSHMVNGSLVQNTLCDRWVSASSGTKTNLGDSKNNCSFLNVVFTSFWCCTIFGIVNIFRGRSLLLSHFRLRVNKDSLLRR